MCQVVGKEPDSTRFPLTCQRARLSQHDLFFPSLRFGKDTQIFSQKCSHRPMLTEHPGDFPTWGDQVCCSCFSSGLHNCHCLPRASQQAASPRGHCQFQSPGQLPKPLQLVLCKKGSFRSNSGWSSFPDQLRVPEGWLPPWHSIPSRQRRQQDEKIVLQFHVPGTWVQIPPWPTLWVLTFEKSGLYFIHKIPCKQGDEKDCFEEMLKKLKTIMGETYWEANIQKLTIILNAVFYRHWILGEGYMSSEGPRAMCGHVVSCQDRQWCQFKAGGS